jgi:hypothetical protein
MDNDTRWNSWFREVDVTLQVEKRLKPWIDENEDILGEDILTRDDWKELRAIHQILKPLETCTLNIQGLEDSIDKSFENMEFLVAHFEAMLKMFSEDSKIYTRLHSAFLKFEKYYDLSGDTSIYAASILLHPEFRASGLRRY